MSLIGRLDTGLDDVFDFLVDDDFNEYAFLCQTEF